MASRWSSGGGDSSDNFSGITYPICDYSQAPSYWIKIALAVDCVFFACIMTLLAVAWGSRRFNGEFQILMFRYFLSALLLIGLATILSITSESLFLADAHVGPSYQIFRGVYAFFYYLAKAGLLGFIFGILHDCLRTLFLDKVSRMRWAMLLNFFLAMVTFAFSITLGRYNLLFGLAMMDIIEGKTTSFDKINQIELDLNEVIILYNSLILAAGLCSLGFSVYLLKHSNNQKAIKFDARITIYMISPAIIVHGLHGVIVYGVLLDSSISRAKFQYSKWSDLSDACVDMVTLTCVLAGIVCILSKRQKSVVIDADPLKIGDSDEGAIVGLDKVDLFSFLALMIWMIAFSITVVRF